MQETVVSISMMLVTRTSPTCQRRNPSFCPLISCLSSCAQAASSNIMSAAFSPIMIEGHWYCPK